MTDDRVVEADVVVVGGGPAGLTAAIALAGAGVNTALVAPAAPADNRTTALLAASVTALEALGVWQRCRAEAAPLKVMRIVDDTSRLIRAPEVAFAAAEIGREAVGHNLENYHLLAALEARAAEIAALVRIEAAADAIEIDDDGVTVRAGSTNVRARLAVGADGRDSPCRLAAGIDTEGWDYPQTA